MLHAVHHLKRPRTLVNVVMHIYECVEH